MTRRVFVSLTVLPLLGFSKPNKELVGLNLAIDRVRDLDSLYSSDGWGSKIRHSIIHHLNISLFEEKDGKTYPHPTNSSVEEFTKQVDSTCVDGKMCVLDTGETLWPNDAFFMAYRESKNILENGMYPLRNRY